MRLIQHLLFLCFLHSVYSLNIAVYLTLIGKSHLNFVNALTTLLKNRGHTVDFILGKLNPSVKFQEKDLKADNFTQFGFPNDDSPWLQMNHLNNPFEEFEQFDRRSMWIITTNLCKIALKSNKPLEFLTRKKYDVLLVSDYDFCGHVLAYKAQIKSVLAYSATSLLAQQTISLGLPSSVSVVQDNLDAKASFSLMGRMKALWRITYYYLFTHNKLDASADEAVKSIYGEDFPSTRRLLKDADYVFVNTNEFIERPRSISHKVVYIGGAALKKPKALAPQFEDILNRRPQGSIIFSFGTQVPSPKIPMFLKKNLVKGIQKFSNYTFIWKYDKQEEDGSMFDEISNLVLVDWMPQTDLLHDPRVVGFITHMGLNSLVEACYGGVPMIAIPLFADQPHNARCAVEKGIAVQLSKTSITEKDITHALHQILQNPSYKEKTKRLAHILRGNSEKMQKRFVEHVEFAGENENLHEILNIPDVELNVFKYYCVDILLIWLTTTLFVIMLTYKLMTYLLKSKTIKTKTA